MNLKSGLHILNRKIEEILLRIRAFFSSVFFQIAFLIISTSCHDEQLGNSIMLPWTYHGRQLMLLVINHVPFNLHYIGRANLL